MPKMRRRPQISNRRAGAVPLPLERDCETVEVWSARPAPQMRPHLGRDRVLAYLARYTHRTAIANSRLVAVADDEVAFTYKDYRRGGRNRVLRLEPHEFIRRFLLHALPDGFHRIRHFGFLAKGETRARPPRREIERTSKRSPCSTASADEDVAPPCDAAEPDVFALCPQCGGLMRRVGPVAPLGVKPFSCDTS